MPETSAGLAPTHMSAPGDLQEELIEANGLMSLIAPFTVNRLPSA